MYYTGTENECNDYLQTVNEGENYSGTTSTWGSVMKHPTKDQWVIIAHPHYESELSTLEKLPDDWYDNNDIV